MDAGKLNYRITLQQATIVKDSEGIEGETWVNIVGMVNISAAVGPLKGREYFQAAAIGTENTVQIKMRYRSGVSTKLRVLYGTRIFNIRSIVDPEERHCELNLMCEEVVSGN